LPGPRPDPNIGDAGPGWGSLGAMAEAATDPSVPPPCPKDGIAMRPSKRTMLTHDISSGRAVPVEQTFDVWRCPACGRELPRQS
jgi:hypothetical protein